MNKLLERLSVLTLCIALVVSDSAVSSFATEVQENSDIISEIAEVTNISEDENFAENDSEDGEVTELEAEIDGKCEDIFEDEDVDDLAEIIESETVVNGDSTEEAVEELIIETEELAVEPAYAATDDFKYSINADGKTVTITGYTGNASGDFYIPSKIGNYSVTDIGEDAFVNSLGSENVFLHLPDGLKSIGNGAFYRCKNITDVLVIPGSVVSIGDSAFEECTGLHGLVLSDGVKIIGDCAFNTCINMGGELIIPDSVTSIGESAFYWNSFNGDLIIPDSITTIRSGTFERCDNFRRLVIGNNVTTIESNAFSYCHGLTGSLTIPNSVTNIETAAFFECTGFTGDLIIPDSVKNIGSSAFGLCVGLNGQFIIPSSITSIKSCIEQTGFDCVINNSNVDFELPYNEVWYDSITNEEIKTIKKGKAVPKQYELIYEIKNGEATITGYRGAEDGDNNLSFGMGFTKYKAARGQLIIPSKYNGYPVTTIGEQAFSHGSFSGELVIPSSITSIGMSAFWGCSGFTGNLTIPNSVKSIGPSAFADCGFTGNLKIGSGITSIEEGSFYKCRFNGSLTIGDNVTSIGEHAFYGCDGFTGDLTVPNSVKNIGKSAFADSSFTGKLTIPKGATIGERAFGYCCFTGDLILDSVEIGEYAFNHCNGNAGDLIIKGNTSIGRRAFEYSAGFKGRLILENGITSVGESAFAHCSGFVGQLKIPMSLTSIEKFVFLNCSGFSGNVTIPENVTALGSGIFGGCSGLGDTLTIPSSVTSIGSGIVTGSGIKTVINNSDTEFAFSQYNHFGSYEEDFWYDKSTKKRIMSIKKGTAVKGDKSGVHICSGGKATCISRAICDSCHQEYGEFDLSNHVGENEIKDIKEATCYAEGYSGDKYCKACSNIIEKGTVVAKKSHTPSEIVKENNIPATCEEAGSYDDVVYCTIEACQKELSRIKKYTDKSGHIDEDDDEVCDICHKKVFEDGFWVEEINEQEYTGKSVIPNIEVYDVKNKLVLNQDYTIKVTSNVNAGEAKLTVTGKGNYTGTETVGFTILKKDINDSEFVGDDIAVKATGKAQKPAPVLLWNGKALAAKNGYTYQYYCADEEGNPVGEPLDSVTDAGKYVIELAGKGNFTGTRYINLLVTDELKLINNMSFAKIANQSYTGYEIKPNIVIKEGKNITLAEKTDYEISYENNINVGVASVLIKGIGNYSGTKRINFNIVGTAISKATVEGYNNVIYSGNEITFDNLKLYIKATKTASQIDLTEHVDYEVSYLNNLKVGTATIVFTGINGYTGVVKKSFKITAFKTDDIVDRVNAELLSDSVVYSKGGAKAPVKVTFVDSEGNEIVLKEKTDYTLSYSNIGAVNDLSNIKKLPTIKVTLKGNYKGTFIMNYAITPKSIEQANVVAVDKVYQNKRNIYSTAISVIDIDGKKLTAGSDYKKAITYTYKDATTVLNNGEPVEREANEAINPYDIIPAGTTIAVEVTAGDGGNYFGSVCGEYRITEKLVNGASVSIPYQIYSGEEIKPTAEDITVKIGKESALKAGTDYEVVPDSYVNNVKKGTASVTIRGINNYGGTKKVNFTIKAKGFSWWWR